MDVNQIIATTVAAILIWALGMLGRWLASKTSNEKLRAVVYQAIDAAETAVSAVQQTYVDALVAAGGTMTDAQKSAALAQALATAKGILGTKGLATLQSALALGESAADAWLTSHIEAAVQQKKIDKAAK
jgi:ferritin-like metal-binding protein YciE